MSNLKPSQVHIARIPRSQYETIVTVPKGKPLTDWFPEYIYILMLDDEIMEVAPALTSEMIRLGASEDKFEK